MTDTQPTVLVQGIPTDQKYHAQTPVVHITDSRNELILEIDDERQDVDVRDFDPDSAVAFDEDAPIVESLVHSVGDEPQQRDECSESPGRDVETMAEGSSVCVPRNIKVPAKGENPVRAVAAIMNEGGIEHVQAQTVEDLHESEINTMHVEETCREHTIDASTDAQVEVPQGMEADMHMSQVESLKVSAPEVDASQLDSPRAEEPQIQSTEETPEKAFDEEEQEKMDFATWFGSKCNCGTPAGTEEITRSASIEQKTSLPQQSETGGELKDVYLPSWLRWIDPTLKNGAVENGGNTESNGDEQNGSASDEATDAVIAAVVQNMDVGEDTEEEKREMPEVDGLVQTSPKPQNEEAEALIEQGEGKSADVRKSLVNDLREAITTKGRYHTDVAAISTKLGTLLDESSEHKQALKLYRDAVSIYSSKLGDDHTTTMDTRLGLGRVLENAGQYDEAINTYYLVTVMRRALRGEKEPSAADSLVCIAHALRKKGDYVQAIKELKRALKIYRESLGDAHKKVSTTVDEIASLYVTVGDFEKSASILEEVVKLKAATLGMKSKEVSATLVSLATTYECSEEFDKSMKTLKKAYKIETDLGGYSSEGATNTLNRIAHLYEATGDYNRASIAYLGVLRGRKIRLGEDDIVVGEAYYKLGRSLRETGQHEKALKCMKEALPIFVSKGVEMQDVERIAEIMHQMALINKDKKNLSEAARVFKQELGVRRKIGQPEFPTIARTLNHLGVIEFELKNNTRALKYMVEALTIFQKRGEQGIDCAEVLFNAGLVFEACNNKQRALEAFEEAARLFREHRYKEDHPHLVKACKKIDKLQKTIREAAS